MRKQSEGMWLPVPSEDMVSEFLKLVREEQGIELTPVEAKEAATRILQIHYLKEYCLQPPEEADDPTSAPTQPDPPSKRA